MCKTFIIEEENVIHSFIKDIPMINSNMKEKESVDIVDYEDTVWLTAPIVLCYKKSSTETAFFCPFCRREHIHGIPNGKFGNHRQPHCDTTNPFTKNNLGYRLWLVKKREYNENWLDEVKYKPRITLEEIYQLTDKYKKQCNEQFADG